MQDVLAPVFAALGRATAWLGPAGNGTRAKPVLNNWLADLTETTAETAAITRPPRRALPLAPAARRHTIMKTRPPVPIIVAVA